MSSNIEKLILKLIRNGNKEFIPPVVFCLESKSGVSSILILRKESMSSLVRLEEDTASEPYPLELVDGVPKLLLNLHIPLLEPLNSARESKVREELIRCLFTLSLILLL